MLQKIWNHFYNRAASSNRVHPLYILPTFDGLKVIGLNLTLLVLGLVYANNYVLLFNFILFCLFLGSMFYTHFNLNGLILKSADFSPLYVDGHGTLNLYFSSTNSQGHYFIRPFFKSKIVKIDSPNETFEIRPGNFHIKIPIRGKTRGKEVIDALYLETLFPFNFFKCFTFIKLNQECYVFPKPINHRLHREEEVLESSQIDGDDFFLRDYLQGDSPKRVDWKKLAQTNHWYTRQFQRVTPNPIMLSLDKSPNEESIQSICFALHALHQQNIRYGLKLKKDVFLSPENSSRHLDRCLKELAVYGN